jgi:UDP-glucuronate decarboxylase
LSHLTIRNDIADLQKVIKDQSEGKQRILITGGAGFLGSWLCDTFIASSKVVCYDNLSTGKLGNVSHLKEDKNFEFKSIDIASKWNTNQRFDLIFHLASRPSPDDYQKHPVETLAVSTQGTWNVLEVARRSDARILFASTSEVYGDPVIIPTPETYWGNVNPIGLRSCYDEGKRVGEAMCMAYHRQYGLDTRIVRIFNTYGPRIGAKGDYGRAIPRFIVQAISGKPVTIYGDGNQTRSFCYVTDTVSAMICAVLGEKGKGAVFNVGNPREVSIMNLAETIIKITKSKSKVVHVAAAPDDPKRRCPDISKARSALNWAPKVGLNDGLRRTISWFRSESY